MAKKIIGISRDLIIHPGETIADVLESRGMSQKELAIRTGFSSAYVSNVISGKKDISSKFAMALEYALDVPAYFWLRLQANYDAELLEYNEVSTITKDEYEIFDSIKYDTSTEIDEDIQHKILSTRKKMKVSNLMNLKKIKSAL